MRKTRVLGLVLGLSALLTAGVLFASNMSFKINYPLVAQATDVSLDGTQTLSLPYFQKTDLEDAFDLIGDIDAGSVKQCTGGTCSGGPEDGNGCPSDAFCSPGTCAGLGDVCSTKNDCSSGCCLGVVSKVVEFLPATNGLNPYDGCTGAKFPLVPGDAYQVQVVSDKEYIIAGSHNPGLVINLKAQGADSLDGTNFYAYPYHSVASAAIELFDEIDAAAGPRACTGGTCSGGPNDGADCPNPVADCFPGICAGLGDECSDKNDCCGGNTTPCPPPDPNQVGCCAGVVAKVVNFLPATNGLDSYDGCNGASFPLVMGQGYQVQVTSNTSFVPAHY